MSAHRTFAEDAERLLHGDGEPAASDADPSDGRAALDRARSHLLSLQSGAGWWKGELETNVTMDAEDLLLRQFLGIREPGETERAAAWIRAHQAQDGSWGNFFGAPGDLSTTVEAYVALRLAGDSPDDEHMRGAAAFVRDHGGLQRARVFTHIWLALFGAWSWDRVPALQGEDNDRVLSDLGYRAAEIAALSKRRTSTLGLNGLIC